MRQLRSFAVAATILLPSILLVGCSSDGGDGVSPEATPRPATTVTSEAQADNIIAECLQELGWEPVVDGDGGVEVQFETAQLEQYQQGSATCNELIAFREWTAADYEQAYEGLLESLACLEDEGYATPAETPSLQVFTEQRTQESGLIWDPYTSIDPSELAVALRTCPQPDRIY